MSYKSGKRGVFSFFLLIAGGYWHEYYGSGGRLRISFFGTYPFFGFIVSSRSSWQGCSGGISDGAFDSTFCGGISFWEGLERGMEYIYGGKKIYFCVITFIHPVKLAGQTSGIHL